MSNNNINCQILNLAISDHECRTIICGSLTNDYFTGEELQLFQYISRCYGKNISISWSSVQTEMERLGVNDEFIDDVQMVESDPNHLDSYIETAKMNTCILRLVGFQSQISKGIRTSKSYTELQILAEKGVRDAFNLSGINENKVFKCKDFLADVHQKMKERALSDTTIYGIETGITEFDKLTCGYQNSDLIILAARPSMGKTSFALASLQKFMKTGASGYMASLEMPKEQLCYRLISLYTGIPLGKIISGRLSEADHAKFADASDYLMNINNLHICDTGSMTFTEMKRSILAAHAIQPLKFVLVDYLQLMSLVDAEGTNKTEMLGWVTGQFKALAKALDIPFIVLSQLSRNCEARADKRPMNSDLRESGAIEQDADLIIFIYRDVMYNEDVVDPEKAEIILGKQRNGPIGTALARFNGPTTNFTSYYTI